MHAQSPHAFVDQVGLSDRKNADLVLTLLHYFSAIALIVLFLVVFTIRSIRVSTPEISNTNDSLNHHELHGPGGKPLPQRKLTGLKREQDKNNDFTRIQKLVFQWLSVLATLSWVAGTVVIALHILVDHKYWCGQQYVIYVIGNLMVYIVVTISLIDAKPAPTAAQFSTWSLAAIFEICRLAAFLEYYGHPGLMDGWLAGETLVNAVRIVLLLGLVISYVSFSSIGRPSGKPAEEDEITSLLRTNGSTANGAASYGSTQNGTAPGHENYDAQPGWARPEKVPSRGWWEYIRGYSLFFPYLWPSKDKKLQAVVVVCFVLVLSQRGINVLVPYQFGVITDALTGENGPKKVPWGPIALYIFYRLLQGSNSLIGAARAVLWIPVQQYSYRELSIASFEHVHSLSLDFHLGKKTGEVLSALGKGNSVNNFLDQVTFNVVPMLIDLAVAIGYFLIAYDPYYALVVIIMTFWYIYLTIRLAKWRQDARRKMVNLDRAQDAIKNDSMVSYETVKYFNAENYEFDRYRNSVRKYQKAEFTVQMSLAVMNVTQNLIFIVGLVIVCYIAAYQVTVDQIKVGKFVSLLAYMAQLQSPLNYFGTFYRIMQNSMISAERLLELFKEQPTVVDKPGVGILEECKGDIHFKDVNFAYDTRRNALNGMDFHCKPGTTTAFVGESGGGKSTVFRLLFRFYNAVSGKIEVDGHDVQDITIESLRRHIGVVPQDTVLFNESLMYNLKYAKPDATDEEVYAACKAASIHDQIMTFPDRYETKVGERGLRLSGGEKQRVAIARTILKGPRIIMLDEATAALDTATEQHIQKALHTLSQGRTMLVIAHRLSTIANADQILVLHEGRVVEKGTHTELLEKNGHYKNMWQKQVEAQEAAKEARDLKIKASRLRRESKGEVSLDPFIASSNETSDVDENDRNRRKERKNSRKDDERHSDDDEQRLHHEALKMRHNEQ